MCLITDTGDSYLRDWGRWAGKDSTVVALGYPRHSASCGRSPGGFDGGYAVAEAVDFVLVSAIDAVDLPVVKLFYVNRLSMAVIVNKVNSNSELSHISFDVVRRRLDLVRAVVGGIMICQQKKVLTFGAGKL